MYKMAIDPDQLVELYLRREELRKKGIRKPITTQVKEAIAEYITKNNNEKSPLIGTQKDSLKILKNYITKLRRIFLWNKLIFQKLT